MNEHSSATPQGASLPPASPPSGAEFGVSEQVFTVLVATVAALFGARARIAATSSTTLHAPALETALIQQWAMEGRRQIYFSHKVR
ncbi:MAG: hypothetical protein NTV51_22790 [Verrucomicrobia bacterium]|nr:hypothetical protein [Verrucomicrobiota bacterium]